MNTDMKTRALYTVLTILLVPVPAFAAVDITQMLISIQSQIPALSKLLTGLCYVAGFGLILSALFHLRKYGEMRTMMAANADLKGPIIQIVVGACLVQLPVVTQVAMQTAFGTTNPLAYPESDNVDLDLLITTIILIVQFVGAIAIARGLFLFNKLGTGQAQPGTFSKAVIHVLGGTLCFNAYGTAQILFTTLGIFN